MGIGFRLAVAARADLAHQGLDGGARHLGHGLMDGAELGPDGGGDGRVVKADDGQVARHIQAWRCATATAAAAMSSLAAKMAVGGVEGQKALGRIEAPSGS